MLVDPIFFRGSRQRVGVASLLLQFHADNRLWFKYLDRILGALDGTCGYFFLGRKTGTPLTGKELLLAYPGIT